MHLFYCLLICTGVLSLLSLPAMASDKNTGNFQKIVCKNHDNTNLVKNLTCFAKAISRNKKVVVASGFANRRLDHIMVHIKVYKRFNVVYKPFLIDVTENFCELMAKKTNAPYTKIFLNMIIPYTNLNHTCPYEGWVIISNVSLDLSPLKVLVPRGEYRLDVILLLNKSPVKSATVEFYAEIGE